MNKLEINSTHVNHKYIIDLDSYKKEKHIVVSVRQCFQ